MADAPPRDFNDLSAEQAEARLRAEGYNELPHPDRRTSLRVVRDVLREPMLGLLLAGGAIYLALGDVTEAMVLLAFASLSIVITVIQERRTEHALEALRDLTSPRALVMRDGRRIRVSGREVVRGDILVLEEGDRVSADAELLECNDLLLDESLLTGESVPVQKMIRTDTPFPRGTRGEDMPTVFSGTLVVRGHGVGRVCATGIRSEIGRIGSSLQRVQPEPPRLQAQTRRLVRACAAFGIGVSTLAVILYGVFRGDWLDAVLGGIALGMSMLPEEFPVVLTVFMAMGAWRISRARVLTRRGAAIETLGSATVLCTDKTGTLTQNRMSIDELHTAAGAVVRAASATDEWPECLRDLVIVGRMASADRPIDPMEIAFVELANRLGNGAAYRPPGERVHMYGLRPDLLATTHVWRALDSLAPCFIAAKGAPEAIVGLCRLDALRAHEVLNLTEAMAGAGLRVLGVAKASYLGATWPTTPREFEFEFLGLVGLADPLRPQVPDAIRECRAAGIRVVMITGDYPATARAIASQAGLTTGEVTTGAEVEALDATALARLAATCTVFARITPQQKLRIVEALKANGEVVAMTGDGVNDAPSLKAAHIGIAMGGRGTDVAREASSLVLLDDDFGSIVAAVRLGRRIFDNVRKAMSFIFAVHVPIAGLALLPLLLGLPILLGPIHIAFLEMVIDPVCSLVFEAETEEQDVMRRPPRPPNVALFSGAMIGWAVLQGLVGFVIVATIFVSATERGMPEPEVRALAFFTLILMIVGLIFVNRSFTASLMTAFKRPNRALVFVLFGIVAVLTASLQSHWVADLFKFGPLHADDLLLVCVSGAAALVLLERLKPLWSVRLAS